MIVAWLFLLALFHIATQEGLIGAINCDAVGNTTIPQTECGAPPCDCRLCSKENSTATFCIHANASIMFFDNVTWSCPSYSADSVENCENVATGGLIVVFVGVAFSICFCIAITYTCVTDSRKSQYSSF